MVVRRRLRAVFLPLALYAVSAAAVGYFVDQANNGARGLEAKRELKRQAYVLQQELDGVRAERADWDRRTDLLRSDQIDRDLLEERARVILGRVHRNDVVVIGP